MKTIILLCFLTGCTPQMTTDYASQGMQAELRQQQLSAQRQGQDSEHIQSDKSVPIIIICNHLGNGPSSCVQRTVPGNIEPIELMR
jgi:hypothetical protein